MGGWNIAQIKTMIITYKKKLQNCQSWVALTLFKMFFVTQRNKMKSHIIVSCLVYPVLILCTHLSQVMPKGMQIYAFGSKIACEVVVFFQRKRWYIYNILQLFFGYVLSSEAKVQLG